MCGIAGIFNNNITRQDSTTISKMIQTLRHRGPEEAGLYIDNHIALAHARLSIIDISEGIQPIHNKDKSLWIIFNGEIFNYPELRAELIKAGHNFYTKSDTEVIVHLYEEYGINSLQKLNGQFAFAIWDSNKQILFIARDRVGIIPLFYTHKNGVFSFASEIKALFANPDIDRNIDKISLDQVFTFWTTLKDQTLFDGIKELPPAHFIIITPEKFKVEKYWQLNFATENNYTPFKKSELTECVEEILVDSVKIRLRSDVPVGSYLSGGLDSSGITSIIKKNFNNKLNTFGIRFEDKDYDEGSFQQEMVNYLGVNHSELFIKSENISDNLESVIWHTEKTILRTAPIPLFLLSSLVRESGYKVVLTGEGSDEIFGGYNIFKETKIRKFWSRYPESKLRPQLLEKLYPYIFKDKRLGNTVIEFFKSGIEDSNNPLFSHLVRWNNTSRIKSFFSDDVKESLKDYNAFSNILELLPKEFSEWDYLAKAQYLEIIIFMSNYLLSSQGDRMSMANSVEIRVPFLDHRLIELMGNVNPEFKINLLNEKFILKEVLKPKLPNSIVNRPKNPYRAPIKKGLINADSRIVEKYLNPNELKKSGLFDPKKVNLFIKKMQKVDTISEIDGMTLIGLLSTQILYDKFITSFNIESENINPFNVIFDLRQNK
ncbi:MAG: asparagine synthase (glutamine-hydrolyzing) [Ignavibacteriota bacterium]